MVTALNKGEVRGMIELSTTYGNAENMIWRLMDTVLIVNGINCYHSNKDIKAVANLFGVVV